MNITITDKARRYLEAQGVGGSRFLRIGMAPGGCSGMTYSVAVDADLTDNDAVVFDEQGMRVVTRSSYLFLLDGLRIDYSDDLVKAGLRLSNPNASDACACGSSFSL